MKKLPIGIQSFGKLIMEGHYYVDKTPFVKKLEDGGYYFLSRPRRFGKSLFLDTLKEAFSGNKELFKGLYLYDNWDWERRYPVIKISFGKGINRTPEELKLSIEEIFLDIEGDNDIKLTYPTIKGRFEEAIRKLHDKHKQRVVVLVDEYDKPILDRIEEPEVAKQNREVLKDFYSVLKESDAYIKLVFITGVSRFSKVSIFSGLNQLRDITLSPEFATVCGYTQEDLETVFEDRLKGFDREEIRRWYNGYSWLGESVYNPFDILLLFAENRYRPYWFETGTPTFLIKLFQKNRYYLPRLEEIRVGEELLSNLDVDYIFPENLLFQTGYLTIKRMIRAGNKNIYTLTYPNLEVRMSFNDAFLAYLTYDPVSKDTAETNIIEALEEDDIEKLKDILHSFFSSIPLDWYRKNDIDSYEGYYASVIYALFNGAGLTTIAEDTTNVGRIDLTVIYGDKVYILEFKVVENEAEGTALRQIRDKRYYEKYMGKYNQIYLIGIEWSKSLKNIVSFEFEKA